MEHRECRHMEEILHLIRENIPHRGIAAVLHDRLHLRRECFAGGHHHGRAAHRNAVQDDLRLRVALTDQRDPFEEIEAVLPAHADVLALALTVCPQIGEQDVITLFCPDMGEIIHPRPVAGVPVHHDRPAMSAAGVGDDLTGKVQSVIGTQPHRFNGGAVMPCHRLFCKALGVGIDQLPRFLRGRRGRAYGLAGGLLSPEAESDHIIPRSKIDCEQQKRHGGNGGSVFFGVGLLLGLFLCDIPHDIPPLILRLL